MASSGMFWEQAECFWWLSVRSDLPSTAKIHFGRQVRLYYCFSWYPRSLDELLKYLYTSQPFFLSSNTALNFIVSVPMLHYGAKSIEPWAFWEGQNLVAECCAFILRHPVVIVKAKINVQGWRNIFFAIVINRSADRRRTFLRSWLWMHAVIKLWSGMSTKRKSKDLFTRREGYPRTRTFLFYATFIRQIGLPWSYPTWVLGLP